MTLRLSSPLTEVKGIGATVSRAFQADGVETVGDLLWWLPHRFEDRSRVRSIASLTPTDGRVTLVGRVVGLSDRRVRTRRLRLTQALVDDGTGSLPVVWFNQPYLKGALSDGVRVWLYGLLREAPGGRGLQLVAPEWEVEDEDEAPVHLGRIVPVYRRLGSWRGRRVRALLARVIDSLEPIPEHLSSDVLGRLELPDLGSALRWAHFPPAPENDAEATSLLEAMLTRQSPAHRRLALEELLWLAIAVERERSRRKHLRAIECSVSDEVRAHARSVLPFRLTGAQRRGLGEIVADLRRPFPMARLLQGDVGAGKTIVAVIAALVVLESGAQVALLAPTELLARQHFANITRLLSPTRFQPELMTGSRRSSEKRDVRERLANGDARLVVGTHALLEEAVAFHRLGLVVIDEQHRFGVAQRQRLLDKGTAPHLLVMTATPIPRSVALSLYGDLDVSLLDELPPGRQPVRTVLRPDEARPKLVAFLEGEIARGGQVYWVVPLIEESEKVSARAVATHAEAVQQLLPHAAVGVVHGRLRPSEREEVMAAFVAGTTQVLCATTVIEVGVDVPAASVMVIENAERFGLAQLHQLRGRVGRGRRRSYCVLLASRDCPPDARERLAILAATNDGFRIAEEDFRLRGPGEVTGLRQWGRSELRAASLVVHARELGMARTVAAVAAVDGKMDALESAVGRTVRRSSAIGAG